MRIRFMIPTLAFLVASTSFATAQQPTLPARPLGTVDVGFRASDINGDAARFQRYQDLRDRGVGLNVNLSREGPTWAVKAGGRNIGYRDQQFHVAAAAAKVKVSFEWNQTPLFYASTTSTAYVQTSPGVFALDPAARLAVQNGAIGVPLTPLQSQSASIYRGLAKPFDLQSRRDSVAFKLAYAATRDLSLKFELNSYGRTGAQPWGAGFGFSVLPELPLTIDNRTTSFLAGAEWANRKGMLRIAYEGSYFSNNVETLTWDNPVRATDYNLNPKTATGYDPAGYITGNGAATGRMALAPSSHANGINGLGMIKLPWHSSLSAALAVVAMNQDAALIPWTSNPVIADPRVYATFPGLAALDRSTAQADVRQVNANVSFATHPNRYFGLTAKYRHFNRDNRTPLFDATEYVRFDAVPEKTGGVSDYQNLTRNKADVDATFTPIPHAAFHVGVGRDLLDHARAYSRLADTTVRVSVDSVGNQYVTVRARYERTKREGSGFDVGVLSGVGAQPASRWYDDANRTRNRTTALIDIAPIPTVELNASFFAGKDTYDEAKQQFGLLNNDNTGYNIGLSFVPRRSVSIGANYGQERYTSLQRSRSASSSLDSSWTESGRDWNLDNDEDVSTFGVNVDLIKALPKTEIRVAYEWNDSNQGFVHSGPRIDALAAIGQFIPLPSVISTWQRATVDVRYFINAKVGIGVGYWYHKYDVNDYQTLDLSDGVPRTDYTGSLMLGYGYRPFRANTGFFRLLYAF